MKRFQNILCVLLSLCIIMAGIAVLPAQTAFASDTDFESNAKFLSSLGITWQIDTSDPSRRVSRAEFVAMAVKIINPNLNITFTGNFSDVTSETRYSNEIYTALSYGLLNGTSSGTFSPDEPITYAAALKILVASLGYEEYAYINGGYPTGYIVQAGKVGITDGVSSYGANDPVSLESAIGLIKNALTCDLRKIVSISDDYVETKVIYGSNCLSEYFGFKKISGILYTAGYASLISDCSVDEPTAQIGDQTFRCGLSGIEKYLGCSVTGWYDDSTHELRVLEPSDHNETVSFDAQNVYGYNNFELTVYTGSSNRTKSYSLDKGYYFALNGRLITPTASDFVFPSGKISLIDNNADGVYDVVIAKKTEYVVVKNMNLSTMTVYDKKRSDMKIVLKNEDGYCYTLEKGGVKIEPSQISAEDVLEVCQSRDGYLSQVRVSSQYVKGTISEIGKDTVGIDGTSYKYNDYFEKYFKPQLGQSGKFLLDCEGKLTFISSLYIEGVEYGYFLYFGGRTNGLSSERKIKVLTEAGNIEIFELADRVKLDGEPYSKESAQISGALMNGEYPKYQLIRFGRDSGGKVDLIDLESDIDEKVIDSSLSGTDRLLEKYSEIQLVENSLTKYVDSSETHAYWRSSGSAFLPFFTLGNTTMISVPQALRVSDGSEPGYTSRYVDDAFRIVSTADLGSYVERIYVDAYDYDETMSPRVIVIYNGDAQADSANVVTPLNSAVVHVVESVEDVLSDDGEITKRVYAYANKKFVTYDIDPALCSLFETEGLIPKSGDVVRFSFGAKYINGIAIDADFNPETSALSVNYGGAVSTNPAATLTYATGKVFSYAGTGALVIDTDNYPSGSSYPAPIDGLYSVKTTGSTQVVVYDTETSEISHGKLSDLTDIRSAGEDEASYVCVRLNGYEPRLVVIYK